MTQIDGVDPVGQPDIERTRWLAELAAKDGVSYLYLSSARVFSGSLTRPYRESDQPDATDPVGKTLIEVEELLKATLDEVFHTASWAHVWRPSPQSFGTSTRCAGPR